MPTVVPIAPMLIGAHETVATHTTKSTIMSGYENTSVTRRTKSAAAAAGATTPALQIKNGTKPGATFARKPTNSRAAIKMSSASAATPANQTNQSQNRPDAPMLNYIFDAHLASKQRSSDR